MGYSIFQNTMVDMTYPEIEDAIQNGACALLPVSVVEEHGPHLCTGTDIYLTQNICEKIKLNLNRKGIPALIAPPVYWGINSITNAFVGSFSTSPSVMEHLLLDVLENLHQWGVKQIFLLNFHGDFVHINKIAEIAKNAFDQHQIGAYFVGSQSVFEQFGLTQKAPYLLPVPIEQSTIGNGYLDIHAGASETSWMLLHYADLTNAEVAKKQKATDLSVDNIKLWLHGGEIAKSLTPLGYFGNPSDINMDKIQNMEDEIVTAFSDCIITAIG